MSKTPEGKVKDLIKDYLKKNKAYYFMPVQGSIGNVGLDFHCVYRGFAFFVEAKAPGKELTPRQKTTKQTMENAGAPVFAIYDDFGCWKLERWFRGIDDQLDTALLKEQGL